MHYTVIRRLRFLLSSTLILTGRRPQPGPLAPFQAAFDCQAVKWSLPSLRRRGSVYKSLQQCAMPSSGRPKRAFAQAVILAAAAKLSLAASLLLLSARDSRAVFLLRYLENVCPFLYSILISPQLYSLLSSPSRPSFQELRIFGPGAHKFGKLIWNRVV